jgi:hypothetical protein
MRRALTGAVVERTWSQGGEASAAPGAVGRRTAAPARRRQGVSDHVATQRPSQSKDAESQRVDPTGAVAEDAQADEVTVTDG